MMIELGPRSKAVETHILLAGGRGTRLFGPDGGCKAMTPVGRGAILVDYGLDEVIGTSVIQTIAVVRPEDAHLKAHLRRKLSHLTLLEVRRQETSAGALLRALRMSTAGSLQLVTACDIVGPQGELHAFVGRAGRLIHCSPGCTAVIGVREAAHGLESRPVWVRFDQTSHVVSGYGKRLAPTGWVFSGCRVLVGTHVRKLLVKRHYLYEGLTDSELMASLIGMDQIFLAEKASLIDVDTASDLKMAGEILAARIHWSSPQGYARRAGKAEFRDRSNDEG
jgi:GTP:adenosylcobinamide-phosphate guanylyltransferase